MAAGPVTIKSENMEIVGSTAALTSSALATHLIQTPADALQLLGQVAPVNVSDISIDDQGRVVVDNPAFASALQQSIDAALEKDNGICGFKCSAADIGPGINEA